MARRIDPSLIPERISCHSLRQSKAIHLLQAGVNRIFIRDILGHVSSKRLIYLQELIQNKNEKL